MKHEYEARFCDLDLDLVRSKLRTAGANRMTPRTLMRRVIFENDLIRENRSWLRVRSDGHRHTLTLKRAHGQTSSIDSLRELEIEVSDFDDAHQLLTALGLEAVRYQENYREEWRLDDVICDLDEWPDLHPFVEIEGPDSECVWRAAKRLGLDLEGASFGSVDELYLARLGRDILSEPRLVFPGGSSAREEPE